MLHKLYNLFIKRASFFEKSLPGRIIKKALYGLKNMLNSITISEMEKSEKTKLVRTN
jgi:hypothetical protein